MRGKERDAEGEAFREEMVSRGQPTSVSPGVSSFCAGASSR